MSEANGRTCPACAEPVEASLSKGRRDMNRDGGYRGKIQKQYFRLTTHTMKKLTCLLAILMSMAVFSFAQKNVATDKRLNGLDTAFARILKDWKGAGFSVAVVEKNKVIYSRGFGYKDYEKKLPVTPNTQFAIGSCTKAFTTSLLGLLNKEGLVDFDKPVRTYLPELTFYNNEMNNHITLRDMMSHRTGVSRYDYSWYYFPSRSRDSLMRRVQYMEPSEPLRKRWQYNNFMYLLQGMVTEKLTGKSWEENIREHIFKPLGMSNSNVSLGEWINSPDIAVGYRVRNDSIPERADYYDIRGMAPAGSINSSSNDMAKWLITWINGGKYEGKEVLPQQFVFDAASSQMVVTSSMPGKKNPDIHMSNYGLGWAISSYRGHYMVEHGGNIDGFSASASFFPSDSIGIVVLANQDGSAIPTLVRQLIADRMLGLKYKDWQTIAYSGYMEGRKKAKEAASTSGTTRKIGTQPTHQKKDYEGIYTSPGKESFEVELQRDSLFVNIPGKRYWLRHYHYNMFDMWDYSDIARNDTLASGVKVTFQINDAGEIGSASIPLEMPGAPIVFTKGPRGAVMTKDSLQKYVGDYDLQGTTVKCYIKNDNTLFVFIPGQPEYELVYAGNHKFNLKIISGYSVQFTVNAKDEVSELAFLQPNGTFKARRKQAVK